MRFGLIAGALSLFLGAAHATNDMGDIRFCLPLAGFYKCESNGTTGSRYEYLKIEVDVVGTETITLSDADYVFMGPGTPRKLVVFKKETLRPDGIPRADIALGALTFDTLIRNSCPEKKILDTVYFSVSRIDPVQYARPTMTFRRFEAKRNSVLIKHRQEHVAVNGPISSGLDEYSCEKVQELPEIP